MYDVKKNLYTFAFLLFFGVFFSVTVEANVASASNALTLDETTTKEDLHPYIDVIKDRNLEWTIEQVSTDEFSSMYTSLLEIEQKRGFFETGNWIRFDVYNEATENDWLLEFGFPLINEITVYSIENNEPTVLYDTGADLPFHDRDIEHRNFVFHLDIEQGEAKTFYIWVVGSGDLHPSINIWEKNAFIEKSQREFILLGIFYGISIVMILYNLFLFFSLRLKSYLYYCFLITFTLLGKLSINGLAYQYLWPNYPEWNLISTPVWVAFACTFILVFSRNFLEIDFYVPSFKYVYYPLVIGNMSVIVALYFSRYVALYMMVAFSLITFITILTIAVICLLRGARQARFYIIGWVVFLTGVSITILERAVILPYSIVTEYAGQAALTMEVVLLSFALADKINIMRKEKAIAEESARQSQKLAMENLKKADELKDEFLAITSHELRTPLYGMIGLTESLRDGVAGPVPEKMKQQLTMIIKSGERLAHLVNDILDFSKLKHDSVQLDCKPTSLQHVIDLVFAISTPLVKSKSLTLKNDVSPTLPTIWADESRLQQVFYNLIDNAIKYTDHGEIVVSSTVDEKNVTIHVRDTGRGIPKEKLDEIFQPFHQGEQSLSRETSGIGIGLNITKKLVELHDGKLSVSSAPDNGSAFSVTFPIYEAESSIEVANEVTTIEDEVIEFVQQPEKKQTNRYKILVADDELVNLQVLVNHLTLEGYEVFTATNGEEVFPILDKQDIDLIILDIMMPGMSGYEVCKTLRETYSLMELPILMLTAKNQIQDKMFSFEIGANDYLVKPCDRKELLARVKTLVGMKTLNDKIKRINVHLEEKVLERTKELKVAHDDLKDAIESRRQLLANIAHELGTPVTLIHNYVQSIQKGIIAVDDTYYQTLVKDKIKVLNRLIDDLYDLSLLEAGEIRFHLETYVLDQVLLQIYNHCEIILKQNERKFLSVALDERLRNYTCYIDKERIDQLFSNLISNAIKHTSKETGSVLMEVTLIEEKYVQIMVRDNGSGIKRENVPYIFDRFYKKLAPANEVTGTGLGLTIVKQIIVEHNGDISVESEENVGTTFYIKLPIKRISSTRALDANM